MLVVDSIWQELCYNLIVVLGHVPIISGRNLFWPWNIPRVSPIRKIKELMGFIKRKISKNVTHQCEYSLLSLWEKFMIMYDNFFSIYTNQGFRSRVLGNSPNTFEWSFAERIRFIFKEMVVEWSFWNALSISKCFIPWFFLVIYTKNFDKKWVEQIKTLTELVKSELTNHTS